MKIKDLKERLVNSKFLKDSFFAVFGNGFGQALLLVAGIFIARILGKDLYGEYGVAKTNMFYMAGFATFGLGFTATKYVAQYVRENKSAVIGIIRSCTIITIAISLFLAVLMVLLSSQIALFLKTPSLVPVFKYLSFIVVFRAMSTTGIGILSGLGKFYDIAINAVTSGLTMLLFSIPFTYYYGLKGALLSLALSQFANALLNYRSIRKECKTLPSCETIVTIGDILKFTFPVAMQELSFTLCNWGAIAILTILSSIGEVGIYSATAQWNAVILFLPSILANVVLSHLSSVSDKKTNTKVLKKVLLIYLVCTIIPFIVVFLLSPFISGLYGTEFNDMNRVLQLMVFATIPLCCADVFKSELIALGKPWHLFFIRSARDLVLIVVLYVLLLHFNGIHGAFYLALSNVLSAVVYFIGSWLIYMYVRKK